CFAQLRDQDHAPAHLARIEVRAKALDRDLPFVLVAMSSTERHDTRRFRTGAAGGAIDYSHGNERIAPTRIEMERDLIMMLAGQREINLARIVNYGWRHGWKKAALIAEILVPAGHESLTKQAGQAEVSITLDEFRRKLHANFRQYRHTRLAGPTQPVRNCHCRMLKLGN